MGTRGRTVKLFIDSSVMFTAVNSPFGGSAKLWVIPNFMLHVSPIVLHEVEKNVRKKLLSMQLERLFRLAEQTTVLDWMPSERQIEMAEKVIARKDATILTQFKHSQCSYLATLDKRDFLQPRVLGWVKPKQVGTPKMLLEMI